MKRITLILLAISLLNCGVVADAFKQSTWSVGRFDYVEVTLTLDAPPEGNPFKDAEFSGKLLSQNGQDNPGSAEGSLSPNRQVDGFCDSEDGRVFRIRFMPTVAGKHSYSVTFRHGGKELNHTGEFTARAGKRPGLVRVDWEHPSHFIREGSGEHFFYNSTTAYWLLGFKDDAVIGESIDRLARLKVNRIRVALSGRTASGMRWKEPMIVSNDEFQYRLEPWPAARSGPKKMPFSDKVEPAAAI